MDRRACGFTLIEMIVAVAIGAIILLIAIPSFLQWYWQQRFSQTVQQINSMLHVGQFAAISTGYWMIVAIHQDCPFETTPLCMQRFRLPVGWCGAVGTWPWDDPDVGPCTNDTPPTVVCEYVRDRWVVPSVPRLWVEFLESGGGHVVYVMGPNGFIMEQSQPYSDLSQMPLCSDPPLPPTSLRVVLGYPEVNPRHFLGICVSGRGQIVVTDPALSRTDLTCPF